MTDFNPHEERRRMLELLGGEPPAQKRTRIQSAIEWLKAKLRRAGAVRTTMIEGKEVTRPQAPFRRIAQYEGLPVIYPDGRPCYHLPEDAVLHLKGSLRIGENLQAAYVYNGTIPEPERKGWPGDTQ